jgi:hypothetical protein
MDKDLALLIQSSCIQSTRELGDLAPLIKAHAEPEDYEHLKHAIGKSIYQIMSEVMEYVEARCPELRADKERRLEKFGRVF